MSNLDKIGVIAVGVAFFAIVIGWRMVAAGIAPKWLTRFLAPPVKR
jgi:hypothetical protein